MKIKYFADTDTLHIVFSQKIPTETRDLDENTLLDLDENGQLCSMTSQLPLPNRITDLVGA